VWCGGCVGGLDNGGRFGVEMDVLCMGGAIDVVWI
jgi:hypothetical protein